MLPKLTNPPLGPTILRIGLSSIFDTIKLWHTDHVFLQACNSIAASFVHTRTHARTHTHSTLSSQMHCTLKTNQIHCLLLSHCSKEVPWGRFHIHPLPLAEAAEATHCTAAAAPFEGTDHVDHFLVMVISEDHRETSHPSMQEATQSAGVWVTSVEHHIACALLCLCTPNSIHIYTEGEHKHTFLCPPKRLVSCLIHNRKLLQIRVSYDTTEQHEVYNEYTIHL